jgi:hypothetical protein
MGRQARVLSYEARIKMRDSVLFWAMIVVVLSLVAPSHAGVLWVDGGADANARDGGDPNGDGSAQRPFTTIAAALKAARPGDAVTVKAGVYHEMLRMPSGAPGKPVTLKPEGGARVILSGGKRVEGWKKFNEHVWVAPVPARPIKFFTDLQARTVSRMPEEGWWVAESATTKSLTDSKNLAELKGSPLSAEATVWTQMSYGTYVAVVTAFDREGGTISIAPRDDRMKLYAGDRYYMSGSPDFLRRAGEWGVREANGACQLYYWPADERELATAEVPFAKECPLTFDGVHDAAVEGLQISFSDSGSIHINNSCDVSVSGCMLSDLRGGGMSVRDCNRVMIRRNLVYGAGGLAWIGSARDVTVEENEVHNVASGIDILYGSRDVLARRNVFIGSPNEHQERGGIHVSCDGNGIRLIDNLCLRQRTAIFVRNSPGGEVRGNVVAGASYSLLTVGEKAFHFDIRGNTFAFATYDGVVMEGKGNTFFENVCVGCEDHQVYSASEVISDANYLHGQQYSDRNLFWDCSAAKFPFAVGKKGYPNLGTFQAATGGDRASVCEDPGFRAAPAFVRPLDGARIQDCTREKLYLREKAAGFLVGDRVEVAFDGRLRKIVSADSQSITIEPALDQAPETWVMVGNWRDQADARLDLRLGAKSPGLTMGEGGSTGLTASGATTHPASGATTLTAGKPIGSQIDIQAYLHGELSGEGKRVVPEMPPAPNTQPATKPAGE